MAQSRKKLHERLARGSAKLPTKAPKLQKGELLPGRKGQLWYVRRLPPLIPGVADYHILFTTPYVLVETTKDDWTQFLRRTMLRVKGADDREKLHRLLEFGLGQNYWNEFVFLGYHGHQRDAIFLAGIPDLKATLPHGWVTKDMTRSLE